MAINAKFTIDNSELKKGLKDAEQTAQQAGKKINKGLEDGVRGLDSISKMGRKKCRCFKKYCRRF